MDKEILMICIADLGLAIRKNDIEGISIKCGTPAYVDPEVLNGNKFTVKSDIFSFLPKLILIQIHDSKNL